MYFTQINIFYNSDHPTLINAIYERMSETFTLPSIRDMLRSIKEDVKFADDFQLFYLDNLKEAQKFDVFQVRFFSSEHSKEYSDLYLSIHDGSIRNMSVRFPSRGARGGGSKVIECVKYLQKVHRIEPAASIEGWAEWSKSGYPTFIREKSLSAFVWIEGFQLNRYLHVRENPNNIRH